jgi:thiamine-phosphate diphosphorylase
MAVVRDAAAALRAAARGATMLQLRDPDATVRALQREACRLVAEAAVPVVGSAGDGLVLVVGEDSVSLPERDLPVAGARRLLGPDRLVGRSVHSVDGAVRAEAEGADYVVFGSVFASASHPGQTAAGLAALERVAAAVRIPVVAIGGVDAGRIAACLAAGAAGFAAIRYFVG